MEAMMKLEGRRANKIAQTDPAGLGNTAKNKTESK
jgi:hypothetical protein